MEVLDQLLHHSSLDSLECLTWECRGYSSRKLGMSMLMSWVQLSSLGLRSLKLRYGIADDHTQEFPSLYTGILRRISSLTLIFLNQPVPWSEFDGLEHLDFTCISRDEPQGLSDSDTRCPSNLSELVAPRLTSLCLGGEFTRKDFPSKDLLRQVERLVLRSFTTEQDENIFPERFPSLRYLGIGTYRYDASFAAINASGIEELDISTTRDGFDPTSLSINLAPRVLHLDGASEVLKHLAKPSPIWDRLEEMHLTFSARGLIPPILVDAISRPTRVEPSSDSTMHICCFPRLKVFTLRYPSIWYHVIREDPPSEEEIEDRADVLRLVVADRERSDLSRLERVQVGWYWQYASDYVLGDSLSDWRITSWTDCSEGEDM